MTWRHTVAVLVEEFRLRLMLQYNQCNLDKQYWDFITNNDYEKSRFMIEKHYSQKQHSDTHTRSNECVRVYEKEREKMAYRRNKEMG
jgi:hypothetical protein